MRLILSYIFIEYNILIRDTKILHILYKILAGTVHILFCENKYVP